MLSAEDVVASPGHAKEVIAVGGDRASYEQLDLLRDLPIPFAQPRPEEPDTEPAPKPAPPSEAPAPDTTENLSAVQAGGPSRSRPRLPRTKAQATEDPWGGGWSKISRANLRFHGPRLRNPAKFLILIVMEDLIHHYERASPAVSESRLASATGLTSRTIRKHLPALIKEGHVHRVSRGRRDHSAATYTLAHSAPPPRIVGPSGATVTGFRGRGTTENLSGSTKERSRSKSRSRSRDVAAPAAGNGNTPRAGPDAGLDRWRESVEAIRAPEFFLSLSDENCAKIFAKAQPHGLTDEELAAVVRRYGAEVRQTHPKGENPRIWGYELVDCAVREREARRKKTHSAPEPRPGEQALEKLPVEPTGKVRVVSKPRCGKDGHPPVVSVDDNGEEHCVYCHPPEDPKVCAEACQLVQELEEKRRGPP